MSNIKGKKILGIIPARGGSKSIPRKNIRDFLGKPLIAWTIQSSLESGVLDRLIVSTDSEEIASIARQYGAETPFIRPPELATDTTPTLPVLQHAVKWLRENENYTTELTMLLEPVSPCRQPRHIIEAFQTFNAGKEVDSVVSVTEAPAQYNPLWVFKIGQNGLAQLFTGEKLKDIVPRRQSLPKIYAKNGALYLFRTDCLFRNPPSIFGETTKLYVVEKEYNIDIDDESDWIIGEERLRLILEQETKSLSTVR